MSNDDSKRDYVSIRDFAPTEVVTLIERDEPRELQYVSVGVGMYSDDPAWAQDVCMTLAHHRDPLVRGNALLGIAHIARRFGTINVAAIVPIIKAAQAESNEYVRFQANDAWDDIEHYVMSRANPHNED